MKALQTTRAFFLVLAIKLISDLAIQFDTFFRYRGLKDNKFERKGIINFDSAECTIRVEEQGYRFSVEARGVTRSFQLRAQNREMILEWTTKLTQVIERSLGKTEEIAIDESQIQIKAWRFDYISESDFIAKANVGDIILFRSKSIGAKITRKMTASKFDHVAMVLKFDQEEEELFLIDATSQGVTVSRWSDFRLMVGEYYHHLFYRKLNTDRSAEFVKQLDTFIKDVVGSKYHFSVTDLLFKKNSLAVVGKLGDTQREYFCSELVAKAYKECGLLETTKASCQFLPADFSSKYEIKLAEGTELEEELVIMLDNRDIEDQKRTRKFVKEMQKDAERHRSVHQSDNQIQQQQHL